MIQNFGKIYSAITENEIEKDRLKDAAEVLSNCLHEAQMNDTQPKPKVSRNDSHYAKMVIAELERRGYGIAKKGSTVR